MACEDSYMWSLSGIVGAFVDLVVSYFLLCAATVVFLASKFLGFFGLRLPCPCDGLFGTFQNRNLCFHRLLIDFPAEKVSNVQLSIKANFPFNDTILGKDQNCDLNWRLIGEKENSPHNQRYLEMGDEGSCSSISDARKSNNIAMIELSPKGKGVMNQRQKGGIRPRRRQRAVDYERSSSVSSYDPPYEEFPLGPPSPPSINEEDGDKLLLMRLGQRDSFALNGFPNEVEDVEELRHNGGMGSNFHEENRIRLLERALEHEQQARDALWLELEEERNAAASAADEAMAMMLRLQEEKASIEMEARQYQRLVELEVYRHMNFFGNEESAVPNEDPLPMLHQISASFDKRSVAENSKSGEVISRDNQNYIAFEGDAPIHTQNKNVSPQKQVDLAESSYSSQEYQEKEMVFIINHSDVPPEDGKILEGKMLKEDPDMVTCDGACTDVSGKGKCLKYHETDGYQGLKCPCNLTLDKEPRVHDVHVIVDGSNFCNDVNSGESRNSALESYGKNSGVIRDRPDTSTSNTQVDLISSAHAASGLPPVRPHSKTLLHDLRGNSMSSVDNERLKIETEVERLRERLKIVQEGREKLDLTAEHRERQLQEIRQLTEPEKALRQASLPLPSSKGISNKRRSRSVSVGLPQNS